MSQGKLNGHTFTVLHTNFKKYRLWDTSWKLFHIRWFDFQRLSKIWSIHIFFSCKFGHNMYDLEKKTPAKTINDFDSTFQCHARTKVKRYIERPLITYYLYLFYLYQTKMIWWIVCEIPKVQMLPKIKCHQVEIEMIWIHWMFYDHLSAHSLLTKLGRWGWAWKESQKTLDTYKYYIAIRLDWIRA